MFFHKRSFAIRTLTALATTVFLLAGCSGQSKPAANSAPAAPPAGGSNSQAAAPKKPASLEELAPYTGTDREQLLIEGAKKEGTLTVYTSMPQEDMAAVTDAFTKKYGVSVNVWRGNSEDVLKRVAQEAQAKRYDVDVVETNGGELETLYREKLVQSVTSPHHADLVNGALAAHGGWVATRLNLFVQAYNTKLIKKEELPKTWNDLLDPRWKGKLAVEQEDWDWFGGVVSAIGEEKGLKLFKDMVATNGIGIRKGHTLVVQLTAAGEIPMVLTAYSYHVEQNKKKGAPVDWFAIEPAIARPNGAQVLKNSPHPHAALLFYDFLISGGQEVMVKRNIVVTNTKVDATAKNTPMKVLDPAVIVDGSQKWSKLWDETVLKAAKK